MKVSDFVGNYANHYYYGKVFVESAPSRSKAMVNIVVKQRGPGWDESLQTYKTYKVGTYLQRDGSRSIRWGYTNRDMFGTKDTVHIKTLSK